MNQIIITSVLALSVGGAAGFLVGQSQRESGQVSAPSGAHSERVIQRSGVSGAGEVYSRGNETRRNSFRSSSEVFRQGTQTSRVEDLITFYSQLDSYELEAEVDALASMGMPDRMLASYLLFAKWAEVDPVSAMAKTDSLGRMGIFSKSTVLRSWAAADPEEAARYYQGNQSDFSTLEAMAGGRRGGGMSPVSSIAAEWSKENPDEALAWALGQEGNNANRALGGLFGELVKTDPEKAKALSSSLDAEHQISAQQAIARTLGSENYELAEEWISSLPVEQQGAAKLTALRSLAAREPGEAALKLDEITDANEKQDLIATIANGYARGDGAGGVEFLVQTGDVEALSRSINEPMRSWIATEPQQAREYVVSMAEGDVRDETVRSYIAADRTNSNYREQLDLVTTIQDDSDRGDSFNTVMGRFLNSDRDAARQYLLEDANIPEDQIEAVINDVQRSSRRGRGRFRRN